MKVCNTDSIINFGCNLLIINPSRFRLINTWRSPVYNLKVKQFPIKLCLIMKTKSSSRNMRVFWKIQRKSDMVNICGVKA